MKIELKPCPFCGAEAEFVATSMGVVRAMGHSVRCTGCGIRTEPDLSMIAPVNRWNRRVVFEKSGQEAEA